uniref:4Fe-4S ferredoxin-type domain-containing protein n=1 Tax=Syphacia muris TaxID=451379 RepID=A0A0N5AU70_9BILA
YTEFFYRCRADDPPNKITVVAEQSETPNVILPPAQVEETRPAPQSPPLPALVKMENEAENPFRPEEQLFHEVDPIVEAYMKKPYPPRSIEGSPNGTPVKHANPAFTNGISPISLLPEKELEKPVTSSTPLTTPNKTDLEPQKQSPAVAAAQPEIPKPNQVECVHIKQKKCGCCSVQ